MIVDLGRIILDPNTDWAITWMTKSDSPVLLWSYIGPVFQELSFRTMGELGPRVMGLVGAVLAANAMLFYLLARGTSQTAALTLSLVFLLDPLFVQSYTMGRVDGWAIAFCITSCYVLTGSMTVLTKKQLKIQAFMAGGLGSIGFLIWPSAIFLFPLIVYQLLILCFERKSILAMAYFILGAVIIGFSLLLPISLRIYQQFDRVVDGLLVNLKHASDMPDSRLLNYFHSALELLRILKFTPFLVLFAFISVSRRKSGLILAASATILLLLITLVYIHRVIYLLPLFIVSIALEYKLTGLRTRKLTHFKAIARYIP
ncbi:MAG TPA: hypothetical protein VF842_00870, partial [Flavobacterium sp.]